MSYDICSAILAINPKALVGCKNENLDCITWGTDVNGLKTPVIPKAEIVAKQAELKAEWDSKQYQRDRAESYPSFAEQLDKIYHDGIDKWKSEMVQPIKNKYPKG
jgi:hypothetical protein